MKKTRVDRDPILPFASAAEWEAWLRKHHKEDHALWLQIYKKDSGVTTVTYAQALDVALCYGWIDGQKRGHDAESFLQRFCPRRARSVWSQINKEHVARLIKAGRMRAAGLAQVAAAKADGRWAQAYSGAKDSVMPEDFLKRLAKDKNALAFFKTLNAANTYAIRYRLHTAKKPETRERRMGLILDRLSRGQSIL